MKTIFKTGDLVRYNNTSPSVYLSYNTIYTVVRGTDGDGDITITDDTGDLDYYRSEYFELAYSDNSIDYAKQLAENNTKVKVRLSDNTIENVSIDAFSVWNKFFDNKSISRMTELIKRDGYCVTVEDVKGRTILLEEIVQDKPNTVILNDEYNAIIKGDVVSVGCQDIPIEKVKEILEVYNNLNDN
jgi:hypothetical protein